MDVKVGPHWYRNTDGTIEIEGLPQIELQLRAPQGPLRLNFAIFDAVGKLHAKIEANSLVINEQAAYHLDRQPDALVLTHSPTGKTVISLALKDGKVEMRQGEFYTLKGHLFTISSKEWSVEKTHVGEGETDMGGKAVALAG